MNEKLEALIEEGKGYNFYNNSNGHFSRATVEFQAWITCVEDFIIRNYGEDSAPFRMFSNYNPQFINSHYQGDFDKQTSILLGALIACKSIPFSTTDEAIAQRVGLENLMNKFHQIVKQLRNRYNGRPTVDVNDEYDVQDLLHALLKLYFNDIRKEEWTPSYAGGSARMDFLLKETKTVIEVKKTRAGLGDKELGKQLIEDKAKYQAHQDCKRLICFVYDPEGRIVNPQGIQNDLNLNTPGFSVEIVIKP